jgi:MFS family permease
VGGRLLRSFATSFLTIIFPLYLVARHEPSSTIGLVLAAGSIIAAAMTAAVGIGGDRYGRRPMLVGLGVLGAGGALALAWPTPLSVVILASGLGGVGRGGSAGSGGAWGPFFPAEQPMLAASVPAERRTGAFGRLGFVGVLGATLGSLAAGLPRLLQAHGMSELQGYRVLFAVAAGLSLGVAACSLLLVEPPRRPTSGATPTGPHLGTRSLIGRLGVTNALNGLGLGFLGPLLTYWFYVRFHVGVAEIGLLYTGVNVASALPYLGAARLTRRLGSVRTVVVTRGASVVVLLSMAVAPTFAMAGALLAVRMVLNSLGVPARQSFVMTQADENRRGTVAAVGQLPSVVTSSISPAIGGALIGAFQDVPIVGAAVFMGANTLAYHLSFRHAPTAEGEGEAGRLRPGPDLRPAGGTTTAP